MNGKFKLKKFSDINFYDGFFDELKEDYPGTEYSKGFVQWSMDKSKEGATALVYEDIIGVAAFVYLKQEEEEIKLDNEVLPKLKRIKIGTLRISDRTRGERLGEGAISLALWKWQSEDIDEIYVTVFDKQALLINILENFGFKLKGKNLNGEMVYIKNRYNLDYSNPLTSFPYINPNFKKSSYLAINDDYHDTLFPYSELQGGDKIFHDNLAMAVTNGVKKIYIGSLYNVHFDLGDPIFIYRKYTGDNGMPKYKSCLTSICIFSRMIQVKENYHKKVSYEEFKNFVGNKTVFSEDEIKSKYDNDKNLVALELIYVCYFGAGNNVNFDWLKKSGHFEGYPSSIKLTPIEFYDILGKARKDAKNVIVNKS